MGFKDSRFAKPGAGFKGPSRHLYISGLGHQLQTDKKALLDFFRSFGTLEDVEGDEGIYMPLEKRFLFVTFQEVRVAQEVFARLAADASIPAVGAHNLSVKYAQLAASKRPPEPECTSSTEEVVVPGALVVPDFLSQEEEQQLLGFYEAQDWKANLNRRVQHYGYIFNYRTLMADYVRPCPPLPDHVAPLAERIYSVYRERDTLAPVPLEQIRINQLTVNEYLPGQGIAPHIDTEACFGPALLIVSLGSDIVMALTKFAKQQEEEEGGGGGGEDAIIESRKYVHVPRRSLLILSGAARYEYTHGIAPRKWDKVAGDLQPRGTRLSLTFRHVIAPALPFADTSSSSGGKGGVAVEGGVSEMSSHELEQRHVHDVYNTIAEHWHHTRGKRQVHWARVKHFLLSLPPGSLVADVGCGDGKYFSVNPLLQIVGCDRSWGLLSVSRRTAMEEEEGIGAAGHESFCCDALALPFRSDLFDATLCIAVLHHLSTRARRLQVLAELQRVTRLGGSIFLQAWAQEQDEGSRHVFAEQDIFVPWKLNRRFLSPATPSSSSSSSSSNTAAADGGEKNELIVYNRYCHVYKEGELEDLCSCLPGLEIVESGYDKGNWFLHLRRRVDDRLGASLANVYALPEKVIRKGNI